MKINTISPDKNEFLQILVNIAKPPKTLNYIGTLPDIRPPSIAIVGTRKPTLYGIEVTTMLAYELAKRGIAIISGLALGVDGLAHRAALDADGTTIAVLANGLPNIYPATHKTLAHDIVAGGGAILSEYPQHEKARPHYFLERNRIVSGLADAIIITEAAARSGTLNTASHALDQGKEVFVVPGPITSPMSMGCNLLIKQGATPITSIDDILERITPESLPGQKHLPLGNTPLETSIIVLLSEGIRDGDELQQKTQAPTTDFNQALTMLEIHGAIKALGANQWTLR